MSGPARLAASLAALLASVACTSSAPQGQGVADGLSAPTSQVTAADPSYDWHGLVLLPFGTLLKESPIALHEVLLFHDENQKAAEVEVKDCYAIDGAAPRFVGQRPDEYLLCFEHDRLTRVEASVTLAAADAAQVFTQACRSWLKSSTPLPSGNICEGREGSVAWSAQLGQVPGEPTVPLQLKLTQAALRDAEGAAPNAPQ